VIARSGAAAVLWPGFYRILAGLIGSPIVSLLMGSMVMTVLFWIFKGSSPVKINLKFRQLQILSACTASFAHGSNDAQKSMGIITLSLLSAGMINAFYVPLWVKILCAIAMSIGTAVGGWRIIRTMGFRLTRLEPVNGFAAETASGIAILASSFMGIPISTTQTVNSSIMGVGSTKRLSAVRWGVTRRIVAAWLLTFPVCGLLGYIFAQIFNVLGL
jgi:PiT family inorganic phosphate transporter